MAGPEAPFPLKSIEDLMCRDCPFPMKEAGLSDEHIAQFETWRKGIAKQIAAGTQYLVTRLHAAEGTEVPHQLKAFFASYLT